MPNNQTRFPSDRRSDRTQSAKLTPIAAAVIAAACALPVTPALAQDGLLEEIVVTARRYEESITDAPVAVAVMGDEFLRANFVDSIQDILELTPGSNWGQFAKAQPALGLRGINGGAFGNASLEHAVSVVHDGVPVTKAFMMTLPVYDLQRVEVLRGPQGTTFGRNATLGMMHFVSARPSQEFTSHVEASTGSLDLWGVNGHVSGGITDTISGRIAFNRQTSGQSMEDAQTGENLDEAETTGIRGQLLFEPNDNFSALLKMEYVRDEEMPTVRRGIGGIPTWLNANYNNYTSPADPFKADISPGDPNKPFEVVREMRFLTAELNWQMDNDMSLTWISGYQNGDHVSFQDAFGTPWDIRDQEVWNDAEVLTTELRLDNQASGNRLRWLAGVFYQTDEEHRIERNETEPMRGNCNFVNPTGCARNSTLYTDAFNETDAFGLFGEITYDISDTLTLALGARYSDDSRDLDFETYGFGGAGGLGGIGLGNPDPTRDCAIVQTITPGQCGTPANPVGFDDRVSDSWDEFTPKVSLTWAVNDENNVYALYSEGFKAGGFQQDARTNNNLGVILDAELATNIEFGWKGAYDNLIFALTVFQQEQNDVHTGNLVVVGSSQANLLVNAEGIENTGVEFEWTWAATEAFTLGGHIASYSPEFKDGSAIAAVFDAATGSFAGGEDVSGTVPNNSVEEAATVWASYVWDTPGGGSITLRGDLRHRGGDVWAQNGVVARSAIGLDGGPQYLRPNLDKLGLRLTYNSPDDRWSVALWGRNLDDDPDYINYGPGFGFVYNPVASQLPGPTQRQRPVGTTGAKQVGATVRFNF